PRLRGPTSPSGSSCRSRRGAGADLVARPLAEKLSPTFPPQVILQNPGGASGPIGAESAAKSPPKGYTLPVAAATTGIPVPLLCKVPYDHTSFQAVGRLGDIVCNFVDHPSVGATTFQSTTPRRTPARWHSALQAPGPCRTCPGGHIERDHQ